MPLEFHVSVAVAQKACVSVLVSAELGTEVFDRAVGFVKYELMLGTFADIPFMFITVHITLFICTFKTKVVLKKMQKQVYTEVQKFHQMNLNDVIITWLHQDVNQLKDKFEIFSIVSRAVKK